MTLIRRSAAGLAELASNGSVAELMFAEMVHGYRSRPSPAEARSWERSIPVLARDLVEAGLGNVEVLLEHRLPLCSRRVDAVLAGRHPVTGEASYVVIELKQWSGAELYEDAPGLVVIDGLGHQPRLHPLEQVRGYCEYLVDFLPSLHNADQAMCGVAYLHNATEYGIAALRKAARSGDAKTVVIVTGGPGSGKSVIALSLLGELARQGRTAVHATGSRSFTQTLRKVAGKGSGRTQRLFKYFNDFIAAERNGLEVLIADEAHRIRETSAGRYTPAKLRSGRPQVDELISAARVPVFLLDEHQVVRPGELGTVEDIEGHARNLGLAVRKISLDDQFRCGGSEAYLEWVRRLLGLAPGGPLPWDGDPAFAVQVADSPHELEHLLRSRLNAGYGARMAAGFCWPWSSPRQDGSLVPDVVIGDWARPWNLRGDRSVGGAPPSALWATDPAGFGQVGCVYTAQGFEYDWNGVIMGPDLVWRDGGWIARRDASRDPDLRSEKRVDDHEFGRLVRNVYKVLLTRGMLGTVIYSTDPETRALLRSLV